MTRHRKRAEKRKKSSEGSTPDSKTRHLGSDTKDKPISVDVSTCIHEANSVLFHDSEDENNVFDSSLIQDIGVDNKQTMASSSEHVKPDDRQKAACDPKLSNQTKGVDDILVYLQKLDEKITRVESRLEKFDVIEKQICSFETEMKKLWVFVQDSVRNSEEKVNNLTDKFESCEFGLSEAKSQIADMQREHSKVQESLLYVQSQTMRNNLVFSGIPETESESQSETETKVRSFMVEKLKLASDLVDAMRFERVHRMGPIPRGAVNGASSTSRPKPRNIVAKFSLYKDRETVRRAKTSLKGTAYAVFEQFPKEISDRRRALVPKLRQAKRDGKEAWISFDTLYVDGRPVDPDRSASAARPGGGSH